MSIPRFAVIVFVLGLVPVVSAGQEVIKLRNAAAADVATVIQTHMAKVMSGLTIGGAGVVESPCPACRQPVCITADPVTNTVLINASPEWYPKILKMVEKLDVAIDQVSITCLLAEVDPELIKDLGVELKDASPSFVFQFRASNTLKALVRALKTQGRIDILSMPNIQTLDNQMGSVSVCHTCPYVTSEWTHLGTFEPKIAYRKDVGVTLQVTPRIDPEGRVLMRVESSVIEPIVTGIVIGNGVHATAFNNQVMQRTVLADDGETVVIGGLICKDGQKKKVMMLILTPRIIRNDADQTSAQRAPAEMIKSTKPSGAPEPTILPTPDLVRPLAGERTAAPLGCPQATLCKATDACPACPPGPESCHGKMNLAAVAALSTCKVSDEIIVNQMRTTNTVFCLSAEEIIWLKKNGVSDRVVMEMQNSRSKSSFGTPVPMQPWVRE